MKRPPLNRGTAEEALRDWSAAAGDIWILERDLPDAAALYNLANVRGSQGWPGRESFMARLPSPAQASHGPLQRGSAAWQAGISIGRRRNCAN